MRRDDQSFPTLGPLFFPRVFFYILAYSSGKCAVAFSDTIKFAVYKRQSRGSAVASVERECCGDNAKKPETFWNSPLHWRPPIRVNSRVFTREEAKGQTGYAWLVKVWILLFSGLSFGFHGAYSRKNAIQGRLARREIPYVS